MNKSFKSLLSLSLVVMLLGISGIAQAVPDPNFSTWIVKRQTGGKQSDSVRVIKLVRLSTVNPNGTSVVSGDVLVYDTVSDDGVSVRLTTTSADGAIAGIACTAIATSDNVGTINSAADHVGGNNWGYIVVHGPANAKVSSGHAANFAVGDRFITSGDSGAIGEPQTIQGAVTLANLNEAAVTAQKTGGFTFDAGTVGDTSIEVFVNLE